MSENLDLVRSIYADWERGDFSSAAWAHPEIELVIADGPDPSVSTGLVGLLGGRSTILDAWEDWQPEVEEYRELDDERVLVLLNYSGRGKASGLEIGQILTEGAAVFHVHGGKVTRLVYYWDRDPALAELGLED